MREKSKFQKELEGLVSKQMVTVIVIGCMLFYVAFAGKAKLDRDEVREKHLDNVATAFEEIFKSVENFLENEDNISLFIGCLEKEIKEEKIRYQVSKFNVDAPVGIHIMLSDGNGKVVYSDLSQEVLNMHRLEFNQIAEQNARVGREKLYSTVYYFSGDTSEYVLICPLYKEGTYVGSVAAYLKEEDWGRHFLKYQYDTILTNVSGNVIFCSNTAFLPNGAGNKYRAEMEEDYIWVKDSRYLASGRYLPDRGIYIYSFIYTPKSYSGLVIGTLIIIILGILWTFIFYHMLRLMAEKTSGSVDNLVKQIRIIRKENPEYVIHLETGDEFEEIAAQINKMLASIHELNQKNMELLYINKQMEIQNLQTQINPHFIYNTLDNIRFLITEDAKKADELIGRFTHILRYSINNTRQSVCLMEDMEYIEDYLVIQKTRFGERFMCEVRILPECGQIMIPKLLLQPLIENSLKYGFQKKMEIHMWIRGWLEEEYLILKVEDDGPGQSPGELYKLQMGLKEKEINTAHIGLRNINRRIELEYGKESGISLESREGEGFTVTLKLWKGEE